jgi:hypothetical protein
VKKLLTLLLTLLTVLSLPSSTRAQASFIIPVNSSTGAAIVGATVTLTCLVAASGCGTNTYTVTTDSAGNGNFSNVTVGRYTVTISGTRIVTYSYTYDVSSPNPSSLNNIIFVDGVTYTTIQAAITAAGTTKAVVIPPTYSGSDCNPITSCNTNGILIIDWRNKSLGFFGGANGALQESLLLDGSNYVNIFSRIRPIIPAPQNPGLYVRGNDLAFMHSGPADFIENTYKDYATTTATLSVGVNNNVLISSVLEGNNLYSGETQTLNALTGFTPGTVKGSGIAFFLVVGRETANEETLSFNNTSGCPTAGTYFIIDATHMCLNVTKTHSGTTDLEQFGGTFVVAPTVTFDGSDVQPSQLVGTHAPVRWQENFGDIWMKTPSNTSDPFPNGAMQFFTKLVGMNGCTGVGTCAIGNMVIQNNSASSQFQLLNAAGNQTNFFVTDSGSAVLLQTLTVQGQIFGTGNFIRGKVLVADQGAACTNGELTLSAGWGTTATVTAVVGISQTCEWTITSAGTGQAANPTITDTLVNALPVATIVCDMRMVGGTGTTTLIDQTTLSATAPIFTFGGTPVAASTYKVVRRCGP